MIKLLLNTVLFLSITASYCFADVPVKWNENPDADYYIVYWGESSGGYPQNSGRVNETSYTVPNPDNRDLFIAVKGFNECGNSSENYSEELNYHCDDVSQTTGLSFDIKIEVSITTNN